MTKPGHILALLLVPSTAEAGARQDAKVLLSDNLSWHDVVDITSFHTDLKVQMPVTVAVKSKYVRTPPPALTAIQVVRLIPDAGTTEIKIVAKLPKHAS